MSGFLNAQTYSMSHMVYHFFYIPRRTIVKKQNLRQYDLEKTEELLAAKAKQRDDVFNEIQIISVRPFSYFSK